MRSTPWTRSPPRPGWPQRGDGAGGRRAHRPARRPSTAATTCVAAAEGRTAVRPPTRSRSADRGARRRPGGRRAAGGRREAASRRPRGARRAHRSTGRGGRGPCPAAAGDREPSRRPSATVDDELTEAGARGGACGSWPPRPPAGRPRGAAPAVVAHDAERAWQRVERARSQTHDSVAEQGFASAAEARAARLDPVEVATPDDEAAERARPPLARTRCWPRPSPTLGTDPEEDLAHLTTARAEADAAVSVSSRRVHLAEARAEAVHGLLGRLGAAIETWAPLRDQSLRAEAMSAAGARAWARQPAPDAAVRLRPRHPARPGRRGGQRAARPHARPALPPPAHRTGPRARARRRGSAWRSSTSGPATPGTPRPCPAGRRSWSPSPWPSASPTWSPRRPAAPRSTRSSSTRASAPSTPTPSTT